MEAKGLVESTLGDPTPERGGKAKRYFRITKEGLRQVHETRRVLTELWRKLPESIPADRNQKTAVWCLT
jgi:DNA-binding PadR family transcriptional regulator